MTNRPQQRSGTVPKPPRRTDRGQRLDKGWNGTALPWRAAGGPGLPTCLWGDGGSAEKGVK
ncbi:hypothetical protein DPEC_G00256880 [Dallia pectoralis]|uniref:Uncharacterized protein n=1 Tax=Dallia pectoralis TaxID=75939 RepID=A0ACC2FQC6_DALPE|nr:hypothetical protein DPEC_G00256880 [Dallia pectoralis]